MGQLYGTSLNTILPDWSSSYDNLCNKISYKIYTMDILKLWYVGFFFG